MWCLRLCKPGGVSSPVAALPILFSSPHLGCSRLLDDGDPMRSREHSIFGFRRRKRNWRTATARDGCFADA